MDFREAERRFRTVDARYRGGEISAEDYQALLYQLQVTDEMGRLWMMQASTGQWYVFQDGRWQMGSPPQGPQARASAPARPRWLVVGGVSLALLFGAGVILAGVLLWPRLMAALPAIRERAGLLAPQGVGIGAPGANEAGGPLSAGDVEVLGPGIELTGQKTLPVAADGSSISDETGATLQVPRGAVLEGGQAQLEIYEPQGEVFDALKETYVFETGFYAPTAQGSDDGVGRVTLRLPAAGPDSRIMAVIDGQHLVMLDVEPQDGVLTLNPRLGASEGGGDETVATLARGGTMRYTVVHPREGVREGKAGPGHSAAAQQDDDSRRYCEVYYTYHSAQPQPVNGCRKNERGSVFVSYPRELGLAAEANRVVDVAEGMMGNYLNLGGEGRGFPAAKISRSRPLHITLVRGGGNPYYKPANGVIYLPIDTAAKITGEGASTLYHELAHWVQDEAYVMTWAFLWDDKTWWLEAAAENMVMLVDPSYTAKNLTTYGTISIADSRLDFQAPPYAWRGESYVQAQLVKLNMCDDVSVCPISEASFKKAINDGTYPFDDDTARQKLSANLDDYARYLLGATPERANVGIWGGHAVRTGAGYGEDVQVARSQRYGDFWHLRSGAEPQMAKDTSGAMEATVIDAPLDKDGVYPLRVVSGYGGAGGAGLPAALRVAPGAPFYYRAGDQQVTFHDGKEELVIQPIHADMGFPSVRVVAVGQEGGEHFRARVEMIDLSGVWIFTGDPVSNGVVCTDDIADEGLSFGMEPESVARTGVGLMALSSALGDYTQDASGNGLTWSAGLARAPEELEGAALVHEGTVLVGTDSVRLQAKTTIDLFDTEQSRALDAVRAPAPWGPPVVLALSGLAPLAVVSGWARLRGHRRILRLALGTVVIGAMALLLAGCFGFDIYGTATADVTFKELEFVGGEGTATLTLGEEALAGRTAPETDPLWILGGGKGTLQVDITYVALTQNEEGDELRSTRRCIGPVVVDDLEGAIFKDVVLDVGE